MRKLNLKVGGRGEDKREKNKYMEVSRKCETLWEVIQSEEFIKAIDLILKHKKLYNRDYILGIFEKVRSESEEISEEEINALKEFLEDEEVEKKGKEILHKIKAEVEFKKGVELSKWDDILQEVFGEGGYGKVKGKITGEVLENLKAVNFYKNGIDENVYIERNRERIEELKERYREIIKEKGGLKEGIQVGLGGNDIGEEMADIIAEIIVLSGASTDDPEIFEEKEKIAEIIKNEHLPSEGFQIKIKGEKMQEDETGRNLTSRLVDLIIKTGGFGEEIKGERGEIDSQWRKDIIDMLKKNEGLNEGTSVNLASEKEEDCGLIAISELIIDSNGLNEEIHINFHLSNIGDAGVKKMSEMIVESAGLKKGVKINLNLNRITDKGIGYLDDAIRGTGGLQDGVQLGLAFNSIGKDGIRKILNTIQETGGLQEGNLIGLVGNDIGEEEREIIKELERDAGERGIKANILA